MKALVHSLLILGAVFLCGLARAATTIDLPAPHVIVNLTTSNAATVVEFTDASGINIVAAYRGTSAFYKVSECAKPDSPSYRCDVIQESNVLLKATDGSTAVVNLTIQDAWLLNRSGHNMWVHQQIILAGDVTVQ